MCMDSLWCEHKPKSYFNPLTLNDFKDIAQWALQIAKRLLKTLQTVCQSLEEFCLLLYEIPQCFGKLQDPWRSGLFFVAGMGPLHLLLNPSKNPDSYVDM